MPQNAAGIRTLPAPSVPIAQGPSPAATAAAAPAEAKKDDKKDDKKGADKKKEAPKKVEVEEDDDVGFGGLF